MSTEHGNMTRQQTQTSDRETTSILNGKSISNLTDPIIKKNYTNLILFLNKFIILIKQAVTINMMFCIIFLIRRVVTIEVQFKMEGMCWYLFDLHCKIPHMKVLSLLDQ